VPLGASVEYVQTILNDVAQASSRLVPTPNFSRMSLFRTRSPRLVPPLISHVLPCYEPVPLGASVEYLQTISNDVAQASRLVPTPNFSRMSLFRTRSLPV
jgi:hypothetical protein